MSRRGTALPDRNSVHLPTPSDPQAAAATHAHPERGRARRARREVLAVALYRPPDQAVAFVASRSPAAAHSGAPGCTPLTGRERDGWPGSEHARRS